MDPKEFLWVERYRPTCVADCILPADLKATFAQFVSQKNIPNMILSGTAGVGKTTVAKAMLDELGCDSIVINGSNDRNIDTLRNEIMTFASSVSFLGGRKYVILDEADHLNPNSTQPALRNFIETYSQNCGFILTCNYLSKIIEPLQSRCPPIDFKIKKSDMAALAVQFMKRVEYILKSEQINGKPIEYEKAAIAAVITKFFPDWRRVINELQRYSATGKIDSGILVNLSEVSLSELIDFLKRKDYTSVRKWVAENSDSEVGIYRKFYDTAKDNFDPRFIPALVTITAKYQHMAAFSVDPEINLSGYLAEVMMDVGDLWKK
jgi:DNA polymerase III delta prime subunit